MILFFLSLTTFPAAERGRERKKHARGDVVSQAFIKSLAARVLFVSTPGVR